MTMPTTKTKVTLKQVADHVGVSVSTASRALSGTPGISDDVRSKIRQAAEVLEYSGIAPTYTIVVAIDVHAIESGGGEFMQAVQRGIERESILQGLNLSFQHVALNAAPFSDVNARADGYLMLSLQDEQMVQSLADAGVPAVIVNGREPLMRLDAVAPANRTGGYIGTRHLIDLGHRNILFLNHSRRPTIRDRMLGNHRALSEAGIGDDQVRSVELSEMRADVAYREVMEIITSTGLDGITAIQCCNDASALGTIAALTASGLSVPEDVSVIGFDDVPAAALNSTPLTTLHVATEDLGARSVRRLIERIREPDALATYTETAVQLVTRQSTMLVPHRR